MIEMYKGLVNSPETTITNNINTTDTMIYVLDPARVPAELPNLMTLGTGTNAETVKVLSIEDNAITVERGFQGIAKDWLAGTIIARNFAEYDYEALRGNILELDTKAGDLQADLDTHLTETVTYTTFATRDIAIEGEQTISLLPNRIPKSLEITGLIGATPVAFWTMWDAGFIRCLRQNYDGTMGISSTPIVLNVSVAGAANGTILVESGQMTINWTKTGSPTGTGVINVKAYYHD